MSSDVAVSKTTEKFTPINLTIHSMLFSFLKVPVLIFINKNKYEPPEYNSDMLENWNKKHSITFFLYTHNIIDIAIKETELFGASIFFKN